VQQPIRFLEIRRRSSASSKSAARS